MSMLATLQTRIKGSKDQVPELTSDVLFAPSILPWLAQSQELSARPQRLGTLKEQNFGEQEF